MSKELERLATSQKKRYEKLLESAQLELDSAIDNKAPQSTIKHLKQRVKALKKHVKIWTKKLDEVEKATKTGEKSEVKEEEKSADESSDEEKPEEE